jgi:hypothetical protein
MVRRDEMQIIEDGYGGNNDSMKMYISKPMIQHWIGSDHMNVYELLDLLNELINEKYSIQEFRNDVLDLWEDTV